MADTARGRFRVVTRWGARDVAELLDATCPDDGWHTCRVVVEQGLFAPASLEFGLLELFLLADERVELRTVHEMEAGRWRIYKVHALGVFDCGGRDDRWRQTAPDSSRIALELVEVQGLDVASSRQVDDACVFAWLTPGGALARADRAPERGPFDLTRYRERAEDFSRRYPQSAQRRGRTAVYAGRERPTEPPAAYDAATAAAEREAARAVLPESDPNAAAPPADQPPKKPVPGGQAPQKPGNRQPAGAGRQRGPSAPR
jgi:hypothetical protein